MALVKAGSTFPFEAFGKDVFLKSFQQQSGNISAAQLEVLVEQVQALNTTVLKVGSFTADAQDTVNLVVEGADNMANGDVDGHIIADITF